MIVHVVSLREHYISNLLACPHQQGGQQQLMALRVVYAVNFWTRKLSRRLLSLHRNEWVLSFPKHIAQLNSTTRSVMGVANNEQLVLMMIMMPISGESP